MMYQLYEAQRAFSEPFADFAKATSKLFSNPSFTFSELPVAQRIAATYDLLYRLGKDYEKPKFGIETVPVEGVNVVIHERIELDKPFCQLRRFKRFSDSAETLKTMIEQPTVLIVAPLSGHYATLLRETVRAMLSGHKVYITDWKNARTVPLSEGDFHLDDYVNYVQEFIRLLQAEHGNIHVMSVCQPTVPVLAAVSLMASRGETTPLSMVMMGGPIDARKAPTSVNDLANQRSFEWFENNMIYRVPYGYPGEGRRVYPGFLQYTGFVAMNPDHHANSYYDYFRNLIKGDDDATESHRKFYDEYNAVLDMDANYYLETIDTVFQQFKLVKGTWEVRNPQGTYELVRPQDIQNTGLITVEGELDDISGSGQTKAAHALCTGIPASDQKHLEVKGAGHYGIFSGSRWRNKVYPVVRDFFLRFEPSSQNREQPANAPVSGHDGTNPRRKAAAARKNTASRTATKTAAATPVKAAAKAAAKSAKKTAAKTPAKAVTKASTAPKTAAKVAAKTATKAAPTARKASSKAASKPAAPAVAKRRAKSAAEQPPAAAPESKPATTAKQATAAPATAKKSAAAPAPSAPRSASRRAKPASSARAASAKTATPSKTLNAFETAAKASPAAAAPGTNGPNGADAVTPPPAQPTGQVGATETSADRGDAAATQAG